MAQIESEDVEAVKVRKIGVSAYSDIKIRIVDFTGDGSKNVL